MEISRVAAQSLYTNLRTATLEAVELVTAPGDDFDRRFGTRSEPSARSLRPGNFHLMVASAELEHERTTLIVLGCRSGRSLLLAARYPWRKLIGVDRSAQACWAADYNLRVLLQRTGWSREVEIVQAEGGLGDYPLPPVPLVLLVDGCEPEELTALRGRLERSLQDDPREIAVFASPGQALTLCRSARLRRWRDGGGWSCLVGRGEQPRVRAPRLARDPTRAPRWEMREGAAALEALAPEWDALARRGPGAMVADSLWVRSWCEGFLGEGQLEVHTLRRPADGRLHAVLPLRRDDGGLASTRRSLFNAHHPYWGFAIDESSPEMMRGLLAHLLQTHDADLVELQRLHRGGFICERLLDAASELGLRYHLVPDGADTFLRLGPWGELEPRLPGNVRKHVPRKLRRLREQGTVSFTVTSGGPELERELGECFELEEKGWKGERGSPIRACTATLRFYTRLAARSAAAGRFALYLLRLDGKIVAFEYCLRGDGRIDLLKLSYDPEYAQVSPGLILRLLLLEREAGLGEISSYHMGLPSEWKRQWATGQHPLCTLRIFAPSLKARALRAGPVLASSMKRALRGQPRLLSALRWGRVQLARIATTS